MNFNTRISPEHFDQLRRITSKSILSQLFQDAFFKKLTTKEMKRGQRNRFSVSLD